MARAPSTSRPSVDQASARAFAGADLLASPLPSKSASIFRAREAGTRAFKFLAYSGRGTRDECPGAEPFVIERDCHLFAPFCLLRACCVCCVINYSFELILCSEHTIDRSAHLFQNKSRRQAIHHFELIRLTWTNFKSIGLHSFDGDFNHVFHLHDRNAFHVFWIKVTQEFGLCRRRC